MIGRRVKVAGKALTAALVSSSASPSAPSRHLAGAGAPPHRPVGGGTLRTLGRALHPHQDPWLQSIMWGGGAGMRSGV